MANRGLRIGYPVGYSLNVETGLYLLTGQAANLSYTSGGNVFAASISRTDVLAAIAISNSGDTIIVPSGTASWAGGISLNGRKLRGPGYLSGSPAIITAGTVALTKHATYNTTLRGFRFTGNDQHFSAAGNTSDKPAIIYDNYFKADNFLGTVTINGVLVTGNYFKADTPTGTDVFTLYSQPGSGGAEWLLAPTMGNQDSFGDRNIYIENNTFENILETAPDCDEGARTVIRYNTYIDSSIVCHAGGSGRGSNDTSLTGHRHTELYNNTFVRVTNLFGINKWIWYRGGSGVVANNVMAEASSPDGSSYPNKSEVQLGVGCEVSSWPIRYQIGQTTDTPDATPDFPLAVFGNTGPGAVSGNFLTLRGNDSGGGGHTCSNPSAFIQLGRDYVNSNAWGWVPYTYPHPLTPT